MVKSMCQDSIALEAELEMQGHPNLFNPVVTSKDSKEWDLLQTLHVGRGEREGHAMTTISRVVLEVTGSHEGGVMLELPRNRL